MGRAGLPPQRDTEAGGMVHPRRVPEDRDGGAARELVRGDVLCARCASLATWPCSGARGSEPEKSVRTAHPGTIGGIWNVHACWPSGLRAHRFTSHISPTSIRAQQQGSDED